MTFHPFLTSDGLTWHYRGNQAAVTTVKAEKDQEIAGIRCPDACTDGSHVARHVVLVKTLIISMTGSKKRAWKNGKISFLCIKSVNG